MWEFFLKGDGPIFILDEQNPPKDRTLFPYNVASILAELPLHIRLHLGSEIFASDIENFFNNKCQHPPSKLPRNCRFCVQSDLLADNYISRNQPIYDNDPFDKDIMFMNYANTKDNTWTSLTLAWKKCQVDRLNKINAELKAMEPHLKTRTVFTAAHL